MNGVDKLLGILIQNIPLRDVEMVVEMALASEEDDFSPGEKDSAQKLAKKLLTQNTVAMQVAVEAEMNTDVPEGFHRSSNFPVEGTPPCTLYFYSDRHIVVCPALNLKLTFNTANENVVGIVGQSCIQSFVADLVKQNPEAAAAMATWKANSGKLSRR